VKEGLAPVNTTTDAAMAMKATATAMASIDMDPVPSDARLTDDGLRCVNPVVANGLRWVDILELFPDWGAAMKKRLGSAAASMASIRVPSRLSGALATVGAPIRVLAKKGGTGRAILTNFAILAAAFAAVTAGSRSEAAPQSVSAGCAAFTGTASQVLPPTSAFWLSSVTTGFAVGDTLVVTETSTSTLSAQIFDSTLGVVYPTPPAAPASSGSAM
jgi:hypothetical protein